MNIITTNLFSTENFEILKNLEKSYSNDADLGAKVRNLYRSDSFVKSIGNDPTLGEEVRKTVKISQK
jgi:hypothetical protein